MKKEISSKRSVYICCPTKRDINLQLHISNWQTLFPKLQTGYADIMVPRPDNTTTNTTVSGSCGDETTKQLQQITLSWGQADTRWVL